MMDVSRVFLSYRRADSEADTGRLADTLKRRLGAERVFTDVSDVEFGEDWSRVVEHSLQGSVALLLIAGPDWTLSQPVAYEVERALNAGIPIIPTLVRRADWVALTQTLPGQLRALCNLNAVALDHATWEIDVEPLIRLLERMLADPARAQVIYRPPDPVSLLTERMNRGSLRALLVHAADLAEALADPSVLSEAQAEADRALPRSGVWEREHSDGMVYQLGNARARLMIELIARELLQDPQGAEYIPRLLFDSALEQELHRLWAEYDEKSREFNMNRGDVSFNLDNYRDVAKEASDRARECLRARLPGLTREPAARERLFWLIEREVMPEILKNDRVNDFWEYVVLRHFAAYTDKRFELHDKDRGRVLTMLERFRGSTRPRRL